MSDTTIRLPGSAPRSTPHGVENAALALGAVLVVCVPAWTGVGSPLALAVLGLAGGAALIAILYGAPRWLVVVMPLVMPLPLVLQLFPFEWVLLLITAMVALAGWRQRAAWLTRLQRIELALLALLTWAAFTGLWCSDYVHYLLGVRRLGTGLLAFWTAYRVSRLVPRNVFEIGYPAFAIALAAATLVRFAGAGVSGEAAVVHRADATNLGWGWANYIAALLVLVTPVLMFLTGRAHSTLVRIASGVALVLVTAVQGVAVARGSLLLFVIAILAQLALTFRRARGLGMAFGLGAIALLLLGPWGEGILLRFTSLRELSSMTIRIWYFREAWHRTVDNSPWGMGLGQGWSYADKLQTLDPHNYLLALSSELGALGVLGWLVVVVLLWRRLSAMSFRPGLQLESRTLRLVFVVALVHSLFEPTFQGNHYQVLFFWMMGGFLGYASRGEVRSSASR
jgi:hypothetical protein